MTALNVFANLAACSAPRRRAATIDPAVGEPEGPRYSSNAAAA